MPQALLETGALLQGPASQKGRANPPKPVFDGGIGNLDCIEGGAETAQGLSRKLQTERPWL